ncbi:MAG: transposase [Pirellulales bacterium]
MATWKAPEEFAEWVNWLAAGIHGRSRWRLSVVFMGMLFGSGRRTVTSWLRAAGVDTSFSNYYYFIAALGRKPALVARRLLILLVRQLPIGDRALLALDDTPTKRFGPKVQGAGIHHNPTPGPTDQKFLYRHNWVTLSLALRHRLWNTISLPLIAGLYVRQIDVAMLPKKLKWKFATKLAIGANLAAWAAKLLQQAGKRVWLVADGAYAKRPFLHDMRAAEVTVVSRLRKDAALWELPPDVSKRPRGRGRPRKYGKHRISLAKRAGQSRGWQSIECFVYGKPVTKTYKTFLAVNRSASGPIRVVLVQNDDCAISQNFGR